VSSSCAFSQRLFGTRPLARIYHQRGNGTGSTGDPPTGREETVCAATPALMKRASRNLPPGQWPGGTGGSPVPPVEGGPSNCNCRGGNVLPELARRSVEAALRKGSEAAPAASGGYLNLRQGVFVTVRRRNGELRGCVGTPLPVCANVVAETWRNARLAVFQDRRFPPVEADEMADLRFEVSVLHSMESISSANELDPKRYGVIVTEDEGRCGLLLPDIDGIDTGEQQVMLARKKARIGPVEPVKLQRFQVDHFEEAG